MTKFNQRVQAPQPTPTQTHEGAPAWRPPVLTELAFTAACTYAGEDTFYETGKQREARLVQLVREATDRDPAGVAWFVRDLRERFLIRGASVLVAAEYANRVRELGYPKNAPAVAEVVNSALLRADEPAEFVAYWQSRFGPTDPTGRSKASLPNGVKNGLALAVQRLYTERNALKWDSKERRIRMADVIELVHPQAAAPWQSALYKFLLDERHHGDGIARINVPNVRDVLLPVLVSSHELGQIEPERRRETLRLFGPEGLAARGYTWERLSGWLPGGMDAEAWEAVIPSMGVFALIRNLRNFDDAGISERAIDQVIAKITSEEDVVASKVLPYRVWSAYEHAPSDNWKRALGTTLDHASAHAPAIDDALIVVDVSLSMQGQMSTRSRINRVSLAALQAATLARSSARSDVVLFASDSERLDVLAPGWRRWSTLSTVSGVTGLMQRQAVGAGTYCNTAIARHFDPAKHRQVVVFTDGEYHDSADLIRHVPSVITFHIGGYGHVSSWGKGRVNVAGYSDQIFQVVSELVNSSH